MRFIDYFKIAFKNITRQKARSILTIVAIVIGSLSVIVMLSLVFSAKKVLVSQLESIGGFTMITVSGSESMNEGGNLFDINGATDNESKKLTDSTISDIKKLNHVAAITPATSIWAKSMKVEGSEKRTWPNVLGYDVESNVFDVPILAGRSLKTGDMDKIVVGIDVVKSLGYKDNPKDAIGKKYYFLARWA